MAITYTTDCIMLKKIYIVGVLVDMIEEMYPSSTESSENILQLKRNIGSDDNFTKAWYDRLGKLLKEQRIGLEDLTSAEQHTERMKHARAIKAADILRKPTAKINAEGLKFIAQRIAKTDAARENPSSSSSGTYPGKGNRVEDDANKGKSRAAPVVERTPDPPAKRSKGVPKGAAERAPSGSKGAPKGAAERVPSGSKGAQKGTPIRAESASSSGKGKVKGKWGEKGEPKGGRARTPSARPYSRYPYQNGNFDHLPTPPVHLAERPPNRRIDGSDRIRA